MLTSDFDYELPRELIAQKPLPERDASRMMVVDRKDGAISHALFKDFPSYLRAGDVLVLNTTRVIPARIWGKKGEREIEFLLLREMESGLWEALCRPAKKLKKGDRIVFGPGFEGEIVGVGPEGRRTVRFFSYNVLARLYDLGYAPLPPYIKRTKKDQDLRLFDLARYQTAFAKKEGSIAAPTAGLHFTPRVLEEMAKRGVITSEVSLDVGLATFQPVRVKRVEDHLMLEEIYTIAEKDAVEITQAKEDGRPVVAVGTTVVRALESAYARGQIQPGTRSTSLFIRPGYSFQVVDKLLTNFHLPKSTLLMLVSAFASLDLVQRAYREAVAARYRFYSYGDCMLIL